MLGQIMQQVGRLKDTVGKLPPDAQQFFHAAMAKGFSLASGGGPGGTPSLGTLQPQTGPYMGDAGAYDIDPAIARSVLARMGIQ